MAWHGEPYHAGPLQTYYSTGSGNPFAPGSVRLMIGGRKMGEQST